MRILFLGNFSVYFSSESNYKDTLERMGHIVVPVQENNFSSNQILSHSGIDLFIWVHTPGYGKNVDMDLVLRFFKEKKIPTIAYHLDLFMGLQREKDIYGTFFKVNHFFTVDKLMAEWLNTHTKTKGHFLPAGCLESESYMAPKSSEQYKHDVIFVGAYNYHMEHNYRKDLINWLQRTYGSKFRRFAGDCPPEGTVRGAALNQLYADTKVVVGDTLCKNFNYPCYFSDRLFETTCRGGFLIFPYIKGVEEMFEIGKEIVTYEFGNWQQLKEKIDYYLDDANAEERETIRKAGHERAKRDHNYTKRWETILKTIFP